MTSVEWAAIAAGLAGIGLVNWYFFVAGRQVAAVTGSEVVVIVDGGYSPSMIRAQAGRPLRVVFDRRDKASCSDEVVFPDFGIRRFLPNREKTTIEMTPTKAARYDFTCGMSMHRGAVIAE